MRDVLSLADDFGLSYAYWNGRQAVKESDSTAFGLLTIETDESAVGGKRSWWNDDLFVALAPHLAAGAEPNAPREGRAPL